MATQSKRFYALIMSLGGSLWSIGLGIGQVQAQLLPDQTLGHEGTIVRIGSEPEPITWIEGGANRGEILFHSFSEFNVAPGEQVYFANPADIQGIFSRVTGASPSSIFGTLGVGGSAHLFLLNPQGILFGDGARLDIPGSLTVSTARGLTFANGYDFNTVNPTAPPLLTIKLDPGLTLTSQEAWIQNRGQLQVGGNLTLTAGTIDLQGDVQGAGDVTLTGQTVILEDRSDRPLRLGAGHNLGVNGEQSLRISALRHGESWIYGGNQVRLRSSQSVGGDAQFYSGPGGFRVETLRGDLNGLVSPQDPIIRSLGDVSLSLYFGSSLHVIAAGSITIGPDTPSPDSLALLTGFTSGDPADVDPSNFLRETVVLSDGTAIDIDGATRPTLDLRAGVDPAWVGQPTTDVPTGCFVCDIPSNPSPTRGDIQVSSLWLGDPGFFGEPNPASGVQILLTNQYHPALPGSIRISEILPLAGQAANLWIDSSQDVNLGSDRTDLRGSNSPFAIDLSHPDGRGGDLTVIAGRDFNLLGSVSSGGNGNRAGNMTIVAGDTLSLNPSTSLQADAPNGLGGSLILRSGGDLTLNTGANLRSSGLRGGDLTLASGGNLTLGGADNTATLFTQSTLTTENPDIPTQGGSINLEALQGSVLVNNGANLVSRNTNNGLVSLGAITITADELIRFSGLNSAALTQLESGSEGNAGDINLTARRIELRDDARLSSRTLGGIAGQETTGQAGNIYLTADEVLLQNNTVITSGVQGLNTPGKGGEIRLRVGQVTLESGSQLTSFTEGIGAAGSVILENNDRLTLDNSEITTAVNPNAQGAGGNITLNSQTVTLRNGSTLSASTAGQGPAGTVTLTAPQGVTLDNSHISTAIAATGQVGSSQPPSRITLTVGPLTLSNGSTITASTQGQGEAGLIQLTSTDAITLQGASAILSALDEGATGKAGGIQIQGDRLQLEGGSRLSTSTAGIGDAANLDLTLNQVLAQGDGSGLFSQVTTTGVGDAGDIVLHLRDSLILQDGATINASTQGQGNGGTIDLTAPNTVTLQGRGATGTSSSILSLAGSGVTIPLDNPDTVFRAGDIRFQSGSLNLVDGAIVSAETQGVAQAGTLQVEASQGVTLGSQTRLSVESSGGGAPGDLRLSAPTLTLGDNAQLSATVTPTSTNRSGGGNVTLEASHITVAGRLGIFAQTNSLAKAGDLTLRPWQGDPSLSIQFTDNGVISASTTAAGDGGSIHLAAPETLTIAGPGTLSVATSGSGAGGNITLEAPRIDLRDGVDISGSTTNSGSGGGVTVTTRDRLTLLNAQLNTTTSGSGVAGNIALNLGQNLLISGPQAGLSVRTNPNATGNSGTITLAPIAQSTQPVEVTIADGASLSASTAGQANAGSIRLLGLNALTLDGGTISTAITPTGQATQTSDITIEANTLTLQNGAVMTADTAGRGDGGTIALTSQALSLTGGSSIRTGSSGIGNAGAITSLSSQSLTIDGEGSGFFANTTSTSSGNGGDITIDPPQVTLSNGGSISVSSLGSGAGGNITLSGGTVTLNQGSISAITASNQGGNITLIIGDRLTLGHNSLISTEAGTADAGGNGGNITITAPFLVGLPFSNSDIVANAFTGNGGKITIGVNGLLGFSIGNTNDPIGDKHNNITASSQFGLAGTLNISIGLDPSQGLDPLALGLLDLAGQVRQACDLSAAQTLNQFRVSGRGGLPVSPLDLLVSQGGLVDLRLLEDWDPTVDPTIAWDKSSQGRSSSGSAITMPREAQDWRWTDQGSLQLVNHTGSTMLKLGTGGTGCYGS